jgi:hypothetical protein
MPPVQLLLSPVDAKSLARSHLRRVKARPALIPAPAMGRLRMVHGTSESRRTIAGWTKLSAVLYDETGHETFADKNNPVFGLGGCAIDSSSAAAFIAEPWRAMKAAHFGSEDIPLHANELRNPTTEQLDALSKFSVSNSLRALR